MTAPTPTRAASAADLPPQRTARLRRRALRLGPVSLPFGPRALLVGALAAAVLAAAFAASLLLGAVRIPLADALATAFGFSDDHEFIIRQVRMPRAVTGLLVGAALGLSGAITQTIMRNPLAAPDLLGVTHGASAAVVAVIVAGGTYGAVSGLLAQLGVPLTALVGGLAAGAACYGLAWRRGIDGYRLLLVGVGLSTVLMNVTLWLMTQGDVADAGRAMVWITGSLNMRTWADAIPVGIALVVLLPLALLASHTLGALHYGDDVARGLGVRLETARTAMLVLAILLAAFGTAAAGPVLFVALACPQIALRLTGASRPPLLNSALVGAALTCVADLVARTAFGTVQLPVGVVTGCLGALYLIYLLIRGNRRVNA